MLPFIQPLTRLSLCAASVVLGLHSGHADQPGEHDPGEDTLHAAHVCGYGARRHRDGRQRAAGFPAEKSASSPAGRISWSVQTAQNYSVETDRQTKVIWSDCFSTINKMLKYFLFVMFWSVVLTTALIFLVSLSGKYNCTAEAQVNLHKMLHSHFISDGK